MAPLTNGKRPLKGAFFMPITAVHPEYTAHQDDWKTLRDAMAGSKAIREGQERYVPQPAGMNSAQYTRYLARGEWYNATARTVRGMTGEVFRKPVAVTELDSPLMTAWQKDVSGLGLPLTALAGKIVEEVLLMGHYGVLLDVRQDSQGRTMPVCAGYPLEHIRSWGFTRYGDSWRLSRLVLAEQSWEADPTDLDERTQQTRYRVLSLDAEGRYGAECYEMLRGGELVRVSGEAPHRRGEALPFIPFLLFGARGLEWCLEDSPLLPLVQLNLRHYRHSCDYEHGLHLTALPTLVISGHNPQHDLGADGHAAPKIVLGSQGGIVLPEADAKAYLLEYQGQGLQALEHAIESDKRDMAVIGARLLEDTPQVEERELAVKARQSADSSVLRRIAETASLGLTQLGQWAAWWTGEQDKSDGDAIRISLNRDYQSTRLTPQDLVALMQSVQEGLISRETWGYNLTAGEILEPGVTWAEEEARIAAQPPVVLRLAASDGPGQEMGA